MNVLRRFDFLGPGVEIEHKGESFEGSLFTSIVSIICILLIIAAVVYSFRPLIWRKDPSTDIFEIYSTERGSFLVNTSYFSHFIAGIDYERQEFKFKFDFYRIVGMRMNLNIYLNIYGGNISVIDHWLYGPCEPTKDWSGSESDMIIGVMKNSACIKKYYDSNEHKYYDWEDRNFKWPNITYGEVDTYNKYYSIVVDRCKEDSLNLIMGGEGHKCASDSEFNESLKYGNVIELFYRDNFVNLLDYNNPSDHYINTMENTLEMNHLSTNLALFL